MDESRLEIERSRRGDRAAVESLLVRHLPGLEGYLRLRMGPELRAHESSADLAQSLCREVLEDIGRFEYRGEAAFKQWLYTRALRKLLHRRRDLVAQCRDIRRQRPLPCADDTATLLSVYGSFCTPSRALAEQEQVAHIERSFDSLPDDQREAITMRRLMGLDYEQIAAAMQRSEGAVRNLVHRGIARLTILLHGDAPDASG